MRKFFLGFALISAVVLCAFGIMSYAPAPASNGCIGGTYYVNSLTSPIYYGKIDSVASADSFKLPMACKPTSITFSNTIWKVAGTPTCTVSLYGSADGGANYGTAPITTYTVAPTSLTVPNCTTYIVNSGFGGNTYTNYMWTVANSASSTISWQGTVLVR